MAAPLLMTVAATGPMRPTAVSPRAAVLGTDNEAPVLVDEGHGLARRVYGRRDHGQVAAQEHRVGGLLGHVGAAVHGNAHVGPRQGRRVVAPVAHHATV